VSELLHGVLRASGAIRARRRAFVEHALAGLQAIPITEPVARVHAATALAHGLGVATRDAHHFDRIAGLRVVDAAG